MRPKARRPAVAAIAAAGAACLSWACTSSASNRHVSPVTKQVPSSVGPSSVGTSSAAGAIRAVGPSAGCGRRPAVPAGQDRAYRIPLDPSLAGGAHQRTAIVHIPASYRADEAMPLVMEFHGAGPNATAEGYEQGSPLRRLSDRAGFIDVFPQGLRYPNGNQGWNAYGPVHVQIAELPFVNKLLDTITADYCVATGRVYASGVSNGANMVNYLACRDADRFVAIAPVAGPMYGQDDGPCRPSRPVPIIDAHSLDDPVVPYDGHPGPPVYDFPLPSVPAWLDGWAGLDGCPKAPPATAGAHGAQKRSWSGCRGGVRIVAYTTNSGHGWPAELDAQPAAETVWSFLSSFSLPGPPKPSG